VQQEARLAVARANEADEAAERVREPAATAQRIGRSLGTFFTRPIDTMKSIVHSPFEREEPTAFVNGKSD
jgi:hypothetical protein